MTDRMHHLPCGQAVNSNCFFGGRAFFTFVGLEKHITLCYNELSDSCNLIVENGDMK